MNEIIKQIHQITDADELKNIALAAKDRIDILANKNFRVGSKVQLRVEHQRSRPFDTVGTITKVNQKTFGVNFGTYGEWKVSKGMIQKAN